MTTFAGIRYDSYTGIDLVPPLAAAVCHDLIRDCASGNAHAVFDTAQTSREQSIISARLKVMTVFFYLNLTTYGPYHRDALAAFLVHGEGQYIGNSPGELSMAVDVLLRRTRFPSETRRSVEVRSALAYIVFALKSPTSLLYANEINGRLRRLENLIEEENGEDELDEGNHNYDEDEDGDDAGLLNYSANPFDHHPWHEDNADNALVFGVELEMESTSSYSVHDLVRKLGGNRGKKDRHFILKSDGSLTDGVELVTMPFTLDQHKDPEGKMPWAKVLSPVNAKGMAKSGAGTTHCGIHIHINKKALSALTIGKMLVFLNSETLAPLVSLIAQRVSSNYCKRDGKKKIVDGGAARGVDRYDIMNISVNHPTCEIRMFRGNCRPERILKNIEFCHALVQYCRQTSMQRLEDWGNFSRWLLTQRGVYDNLVQFLIEKNAVGFRQVKRESNEFYTYPVLEEV